MNRGFGLVGLLISTAIIAMVIFGSYYYSNPANKAIKENNGIEGMKNKAEDAKNMLNESNKNISDNLNEI